MTTGATDLSVCNRALAECVARYTMTGTLPNFDQSAAAQACALLYVPAWQMLLREQDTEFSRAVIGLTPGGVPSVWPNSYLYPSDCLKIRTVMPPSWDQNNPSAIRWTVETQVVASVPTRLIMTNIVAADLVYTTSNVTPAEWDSNFEESVVRLLASELALALAGRPDLSRTLLGQAGNILQSGEGKDS